MTDRFWARFFLAAGIYNILAGLPLVTDPGLLSSIIELPDGDWLFVRVAGACITESGAGYLLVSSDLDRNRGIVQIGVLGKSLIFVVGLICWLAGTIDFGAFLIGAIDIAWAAFFVLFLVRNPVPGAPSPATANA